ncbi:OmpW family protein [Phenylobacterium sp. J367]|uniref:OmpW/AlkL family protein n=1 Tax=Phenylobacterium sp. J367 TaxID=2898435 RepID=UPI002151E326|nr:OmpW family outer membrane protein [Phenylobacterium sp. J367]MCR5878608.1 outer membrane beta-barrel protein [Phenylobacterium sp. J367]
MKIAAAAALAAATLAGAANAQEASRWFVHAGPAYVEPSESAEMTAGGAPVAGANVTIDGEWTAEVEIGYFVTPNIAIAAAGGFPPKFDVMASGTLAALGKAGSMTGGPAGVMAQYHFNPEGRFQPYVGAGASFLIVFDTKDGALSDLEADSAVGTVLQVGANLMANERWGGFVDVKKAWVGTVAKANLGPTPVRAKVKVDPLVVNAGLTYRF